MQRLERIHTLQRWITREIRRYGGAELEISEALEGDISER